MRPPERDLVILLQAVSVHLNDEVLARVRADVGDDIRFHDGYVFQHLVEAPLSVSELAARLGVTQQAASKQVADLVERHLVVRRRDPRDSRAWRLSLSDRGLRAVEAGRTARRSIADALADALGPAELSSLSEQLQRVSNHTGAMEQLLGRAIRPEQAR